MAEFFELQSSPFVKEQMAAMKQRIAELENRKCVNCRHWQREENNLGICNLITIEKPTERRIRSAYILAIANEAWLECREDFGCNLFEANG